MDVIGIFALKGGFYGAKPKALYLRQIISCTVDWTTTVGAKDSGLVWNGPELFKQLGARDELELGRFDGANSNEGRALGFATL